MAAFDTTRPVAVLNAGRIVSYFTDVAGNVASWNDARVTRNALGKLSARELEDIGLAYADIEGIAQRHIR